MSTEQCSPSAAEQKKPRLQLYMDNFCPTPVKRFQFPGGERHVRIDSEPNLWDLKHVMINLLAKGPEDIIDLMLLVDALKRRSDFKQNTVLRLHIPYLPYARQDRVCNAGEPLSIAVMARLLDEMGFHDIGFQNVHSDVAQACFRKTKVNNAPLNLLLESLHDQGALTNTILVAPDAGALKKTHDAASFFKLQYVGAEKVRDTMTGAITSTVVHFGHVGDKNFLIVDDICDGGRTFIELAKVLRPLTNGQVNLYVTHGIFSQGKDVFNGLIDNVYCTNDFTQYE